MSDCCGSDKARVYYRDYKAASANIQINYPSGKIYTIYIEDENIQITNEAVVGWNLFFGSNHYLNNNCTLRNSYDLVGQLSTEPLLIEVSSGGISCPNPITATWNNFGIHRFSGYPIWGKEPVGDCRTIITNNGNVVFDRTEDDCPKVNVLKNCNNGYTLQGDCCIKDDEQYVDLELLNAKVPTAFDEIFDDARFVPQAVSEGAVVVTKDNAIQIKKDICDPSWASFITQVIKQVDSDVGCPPPEYRIVCDPDENECPPGTCRCGDCCFSNSTGQFIKRLN